jgi:ABC-2 type transport system ATP-binding protein
MKELFRVQGLSVRVATGHLWRRRLRQLLHDVSFAVDEGNMVAYLGPNGAGKTTTFRTICGLTAHGHGRFYWRDTPVTADALHRHLGFLPEHPYFYRALTPRELLDGLGRLSGLSAPLVSERIRYWSGRLDFSAVLDRPIRTCSKGQMQRVGLAQALLHDPEFLILDEPMSGLDPLGRECVRSALREVNQAGKTILFSSHILSDAEAMCHRVVALNHGKIVYAGPMRHLLQDQGAWRIQVQGVGPDTRWPGTITAQRLPDGLVQLSGKESAISLHEAIDLCRHVPACRIISATPVRRSLEEAFVHLVSGDVADA